MDRSIQPLTQASPFGPPGHAAPHRPGPAAAPQGKGMGVYIRAARRRAWLVVAVALTVIVPGSVYVLRQPNVYRAVGIMRIEAPTPDDFIKGIVQHGNVAELSKEALERYVPNRLAEFKNRDLAEHAATNRELHISPDAIEETVDMLVNGITTRRHSDSNTFDVTLEGQDPARITILLNTLLQEFALRARSESTQALSRSKELAATKLRKLNEELKSLDTRIDTALKQTPFFTPDGKHILQQQQADLDSQLLQKSLRFDEAMQQQRLSLMAPQRKAAPQMDPRIPRLLEQKEHLLEQLEHERRIAKHFTADPAGKYHSRMLQKTLDELERLQKQPAEAETDLMSMFLEHHNEDMVKLEKRSKALQEQVQATMPMYQAYLGLLRDRERLQQSYDEMEERLGEFEFLAETQREPVKIVQPALEPKAAIRPKRSMSLAVVVFLGFALGFGLVCALESIDHRVKAPEQLTAGLSLPLLSIVPRIRRTSRNNRGGHLWTPATPSSIEADAFRNLRASLLGAQPARGRAANTLLVTSAKAGEGKSTVALNLAATYARSGERTLLIEVDLRRPSLTHVFDDVPQADGRPASDHELGLVDALRDDMPWQRAVLKSEHKCLDFLPAGDPTGIPIEILGSLEMRQLLIAASRQYQRVILDGPAVLGMADCRTLGRIVESAVLVVRCGAHDLASPQRAKAMLELSQVPIAGVVFNALDENIEAWSNHGEAALERPTPRGLPGAAAPVGA